MNKLLKEQLDRNCIKFSAQSDWSDCEFSDEAIKEMYFKYRMRWHDFMQRMERFLDEQITADLNKSR